MPTPPNKKTPAPRRAAVKKPIAEVIDNESPATDATSPTALRLKTLVDRVTASTGGKKKGVKEIVEATLAQLGTALENGEALNLPGFGRLRVAKGSVDGSPMTLKLRRAPVDGAKKKPANEPLAEPVDQG